MTKQQHGNNNTETRKHNVKPRYPKIDVRHVTVTCITGADPPVEPRVHVHPPMHRQKREPWYITAEPLSNGWYGGVMTNHRMVGNPMALVAMAAGKTRARAQFREVRRHLSSSGMRPIILQVVSRFQVVIAHDSQVAGYAFCSPDDEYKRWKGEQLARERYAKARAWVDSVATDGTPRILYLPFTVTRATDELRKSTTARYTVPYPT